MGRTSKTKRKTFRRRNYRAEYQRRIAKALSAGKSRSAARGHAIASDLPRPEGPIDRKSSLEKALTRLKKGATQRSAAAAENVSVEKLRVYQKLNTASVRQGRQWVIYDTRPKPMHVATNGRIRSVDVPADDAGQVGHYWIAVNRFLDSNKRSYLEPFAGEGVRDVHSRFFPFEVDPNVLYKLDSFGELDFLEIYSDVTK